MTGRSTSPPGHRRQLVGVPLRIRREVVAESLVQPVDRPFEQAAVVGEEPVTVEVEPVDRHQGLDDLVVMVELLGTVADVEAGTEGQTRQGRGAYPMPPES